MVSSPLLSINNHDHSPRPSWSPAKVIVATKHKIDAQSRRLDENRSAAISLKMFHKEAYQLK